MRRNIRSCNNQRNRVMNRELSELIAARRLKKKENEHRDNITGISHDI